MTKTYDEKCYELAEHFLEEERCREDYKVQVDLLACEIQHCIEDFLFVLNPKQ